MVLLSDDLGKEICKALGLNTDEVSRIIIDMQACGPVLVYVQMIGSKGLLSIDWSIIEKSEITVIE